MSDSSYYFSLIGSLAEQYENAKASNKIIGEKISQLREARGYLNAAKDNAESLNSALGKTPAPCGIWQGTLANNVAKGLSNGAVAAGGIASGLGDGMGEIDAHIRQLQSEYNEAVALLGYLDDAIDTAYADLQRALAGE